MNTNDATTALERLKQGNKTYVSSTQNPTKLTEATRTQTAEQGQKPYAVVITCSDSRVPPEHIFATGIGELFVVRTAGNVLDEVALGSVEYGVEHLGAPLVLIMGHTHCGAIAATLEGSATGTIKIITDKIAAHIHEEQDPATCEVLNAQAVAAEIQSSPVIKHLIDEAGVQVTYAHYDIKSGAVSFFNE